MTVEGWPSVLFIVRTELMQHGVPVPVPVLACQWAAAPTSLPAVSPVVRGVYRTRVLHLEKT